MSPLVEIHFIFLFLGVLIFQSDLQQEKEADKSQLPPLKPSNKPFMYYDLEKYLCSHSLSSPFGPNVDFLGHICKRFILLFLSNIIYKLFQITEVEGSSTSCQVYNNYISVFYC